MFLRSSTAKAMALGSMASAGLFLAAFAADQVAGTSATTAQLQTIRILQNFYMIAGAGTNIALQTGDDGTVLVDAGTLAAADQALSAIKTITDQPIRFIIDTSADADAVAGSGTLSQAGRNIDWTGSLPPGAGYGAPPVGFAATILAPVSVLLRVSAPTGEVAPFPEDVWPSQAFDGGRKYIYFNHEAIEIYRQAAHDDTDSIVFFRGSDVIAAGDVIDADHFPNIDVKHGGSIQGEIDALNHILELADRPIPFVYESGGTYIVPGHGRLYQQADVVQYRDMMVIIKTIIESMIKQSMTLSQIEAAAPCLAYEREYGADSGQWTTNDFVQAVYASLTRHASHPHGT